MSHLSAVPPPPDYPEHKGRRVEWDSWHLPLNIHCLPRDECRNCGTTERGTFTTGKVHPLPGETVEIDRHEEAGRQPGHKWAPPRKVKAWPTYDLVAFRCRCGDLVVYDKGEDGLGFDEVDTAQPTLF